MIHEHDRLVTIGKKARRGMYEIRLFANLREWVDQNPTFEQISDRLYQLESHGAGERAARTSQIFCHLLSQVGPPMLGR